MSEKLVVEHCSPTLAGIKTGNLFSCSLSSKDDLISAVRTINRKLVPKGIRVLPLRSSGKRALIYVYRPSALKRDFADPVRCTFLDEAGYDSDDSAGCVARLGRRLREKDGFPHEIGLFLSYPPDDVKNFIQHKGADYKCLGCWKVYGNEAKAKKTFCNYKSCTTRCLRKWHDGTKLEDLAATVLFPE